jgi:hypothetical protein
MNEGEAGYVEMVGEESGNDPASRRMLLDGLELARGYGQLSSQKDILCERLQHESSLEHRNMRYYQIILCHYFRAV